MKNLLMTKSNDLNSDKFNEHTSKPHNNTGIHLLLTTCKVTSADAILSILQENIDLHGISWLL